MLKTHPLEAGEVCLGRISADVATMTGGAQPDIAAAQRGEIDLARQICGSGRWPRSTTPLPLRPPAGVTRVVVDPDL